jgi:hypothetical protein
MSSINLFIVSLLQMLVVYIGAETSRSFLLHVSSRIRQQLVHLLFLEQNQLLCVKCIRIHVRFPPFTATKSCAKFVVRAVVRNRSTRDRLSILQSFVRQFIVDSTPVDDCLAVENCVPIANQSDQDEDKSHTAKEDQPVAYLYCVRCLQRYIYPKTIR